MAKEDKSKWNVKDFSDADIYDAIRYLEPHPETSPTEDEDQNVVICVCLYIVAVGWFGVFLAEPVEIRVLSSSLLVANKFRTFSDRLDPFVDITTLIDREMTIFDTCCQRLCSSESIPAAGTSAWPACGSYFLAPAELVLAQEDQQGVTTTATPLEG